jgi:hypothetical protein
MILRTALQEGHLAGGSASTSTFFTTPHCEGVFDGLEDERTVTGEVHLLVARPTGENQSTRSSPGQPTPSAAERRPAGRSRQPLGEP